MSKHTVACLDVNTGVSHRGKKMRIVLNGPRFGSLSLAFPAIRRCVLRDLHGRESKEATFRFLDKAAGTLKRHASGWRVRVSSGNWCRCLKISRPPAPLFAAAADLDRDLQLLMAPGEGRCNNSRGCVGGPTWPGLV